jgi:hypothetical protein
MPNIKLEDKWFRAKYRGEIKAHKESKIQEYKESNTESSQ